VLAVVTSNPRFYQGAVRELEKNGVGFLSLDLRDPIPPEVELVITTPEERADVQFPQLVAASSASDAVREALDRYSGMKTAYNALLVGIDPGKRTGISVIGERRAVYEKSLSSPEDVVAALQEVADRFKPKEVRIKVGAAGGAYRNRIIAKLQENFQYPIEVVDEDSTTGPKIDSRRLGVQKDVLAARKIASKQGRTIKRAVEVRSTPGEVKNVQRESRRRSGQVTISTKLASAVVRGEMTLDEAIRFQKRKSG